MSNPPAFGQPDRTGSGEWFYEPDADFASGDNGGVHENSGVGGKAAFLMTDGASFNGQTISGLGNREDAPDPLRRRHQPADLGERLPGLRQRPPPGLLRPGRRARNHRRRLRTGREDGARDRNGEAAAVRRRRPGRASARPGRHRTLAFFDDLENPGSGNWAAGSLRLRTRRASSSTPQVPNTTGFDATYASSGTDEHLGRRRERGHRLGDRDDEKRHRPERRPDALRPRARLRVRRRQRATTAASSNTAPTAALTGPTRAA